MTYPVFIYYIDIFLGPQVSSEIFNIYETLKYIHDFISTCIYIYILLQKLYRMHNLYSILCQFHYFHHDASFTDYIDNNY